MFRAAVVLILSALLMQQSEQPTVNRITVYTGYSSTILLEYAHRYLQEKEPLGDDAIAALRRELMSTGLFSDVRVDARRSQESNSVDIDIFPVWRSRPQTLATQGIAFEGLGELDQTKIRQALRRKRSGVGYPLLTSVQRLRMKLFEAVEEVYKQDPDHRDRFEKLINDTSFKISRISPRRFKITVYKQD